MRSAAFFVACVLVGSVLVLLLGDVEADRAVTAQPGPTLRTTQPGPAAPATRPATPSDPPKAAAPPRDPPEAAPPAARTAATDLFDGGPAGVMPCVVSRHDTRKSDPRISPHRVHQEAGLFVPWAYLKEPMDLPPMSAPDGPWLNATRIPPPAEQPYGVFGLKFHKIGGTTIAATLANVSVHYDIPMMLGHNTINVLRTPGPLVPTARHRDSPLGKLPADAPIHLLMHLREPLDRAISYWVFKFVRHAGDKDQSVAALRRDLTELSQMQEYQLLSPDEENEDRRACPFSVAKVLENAERRISEFSVLGLTHDFETYMTKLHLKFGWDLEMLKLLHLKEIADRAKVSDFDEMRDELMASQFPSTFIYQRYVEMVERQDALYHKTYGEEFDKTLREFVSSEEEFLAKHPCRLDNPKHRPRHKDILGEDIENVANLYGLDCMKIGS